MTGFSWKSSTSSCWRSVILRVSSSESRSRRPFLRANISTSLRLNAKTSAGKRSSSTSSFKRPRASGFCDAGAPRRPRREPPRRPLVRDPRFSRSNSSLAFLRIESRRWGPKTPVFSAYIQCDSGTGRADSWMTSRPCGRIFSSQEPSSSTFWIVADKQIKRTDGGRKIRLSSQTVPRSRSSR